MILVIVGLIAIFSLVSSCVPVDSPGLRTEQVRFSRSDDFHEDEAGANEPLNPPAPQQESRLKLNLGSGLSLSGAMTGGGVHLPNGPLRPNQLPAIIQSSELLLGDLSPLQAATTAGATRLRAYRLDQRKALLMNGRPLTSENNISVDDTESSAVAESSEEVETAGAVKLGETGQPSIMSEINGDRSSSEIASLNQSVESTAVAVLPDRTRWIAEVEPTHRFKDSEEAELSDTTEVPDPAIMPEEDEGDGDGWSANITEPLQLSELNRTGEWPQVSGVNDLDEIVSIGTSQEAPGTTQATDVTMTEDTPTVPIEDFTQREEPSRPPMKAMKMGPDGFEQRREPDPVVAVGTSKTRNLKPAPMDSPIGTSVVSHQIQFGPSISKESIAQQIRPRDRFPDQTDNPDSAAVRLSSIELYHTGPNSAKLMIRSNKPIQDFESTFLQDPPRIEVDIKQATNALPDPVKSEPKGPVKRILSSQSGTGPDKMARVVIELASQLPYHIEAGSGPMEIIIGETETATALMVAATQVPEPSSRRSEVGRLPVPEKLGVLPGLAVRISVDLRQMDMLAVMKFLAEEGNLNIVTGKNVGGRVSLNLKDVSLQDILDIIALSYELAYVVQNGIIQVMTEADYQRLFGASFADQRKVKRLQLQNADPAAVSAVLNNMKSAVGRVIADVQSRTLVLIDVPDKLEPMALTALSMDQATQLETQVFELHYGKAEEVQAEVEKVLTPNLGGSRIDKRTNTLVVTDLSTRMRNVERIIGAFDRKTREVIIESKIVQIRLNDQFQMGVNWEKLFTEFYNLNFAGNFTVAPPLARFGQMSIGTLADDDFNVVVQMLQTVGNTNILSRPQIAVVENQEAKILVGTREAFVTSVVTQTQQAATTAEEVTFVDVGVSLTATPTINREGFVTMKIKPEVSSVNRTLTTAAGNEIPIVETSTAETTVMVKDGATIVIAGLMKDDNVNETKKVPILGDIPILGAAFRSKDENSIKSELVIFLTPRIISGQDSIGAPPASP